jgi:hypothetical protein
VEESCAIDNIDRNKYFDPEKLRRGLKTVNNSKAGLGWKNNFLAETASLEGVRIDDFDRNRNFDREKLRTRLKSAEYF